MKIKKTLMMLPGGDCLAAPYPWHWASLYVKELYLNNITIGIPGSSRLRDRNRKENRHTQKKKIQGKIQENKQEAETVLKP